MMILIVDSVFQTYQLGFKFPKLVKSCQTFTGSAIFENMETEDVDDLWTQLYGVGVHCETC